MSTISSHVLDTSLGHPAVGVGVVLEVMRSDGSWALLSEQRTDEDGRVRQWGSNQEFSPGLYRVKFDTQAYFASEQGGGTNAFYPWVDVVFSLVESSTHYHIPLLLSRYGYSTYRGS